MVKRPGTKAKGRNHEAGLVAVKRPDLSHKTAIPVAQRRNLHKNLHKQRYYKQGLMTKTGKKLSGNTVNKTRRGAGADARARPEGRITPLLAGAGKVIGTTPTAGVTRSSAVPRLFRARNVQNYFGQP